MIHYLEGSVLESGAQALVNTVNTVGVMGKGIALQFKRAYPDNFKAYSVACKTGGIAIGKLFITSDADIIGGEKIIINFPTKTDWRKPSEYQYIEEGLTDLIRAIEKYNIKSIAIPPLGSGNGGLAWEQVKKIIEKRLSHIDNVDIYVYEPTAQIKERLKKERAKLTDARAMLLYVLYDLVRNGEYVSEFSSEKVCYFMQRFGAEKYFRLQFEPNFYGPYSGKVRYVLNVLNGSYITGYSDMNKKPFDPLMLVQDGYETVTSYVENRTELKTISDKTTKFLAGFYSDFALELLSSIDYIICKEKSWDEDLIFHKLNEWNSRKRSIFSDKRYITISLQQLKTVFN
jgi:O-acetyl-ADP-ribose deacetylase (regulator of RNase III)/uncharacterized protein YwgA